MKDIATQTIEKIYDIVETQEDNLRTRIVDSGITEQDIREFAGIMDPKGTDEKKIEALEINVEHFRLLALRETDPDKEVFYKKVSEVAELKADNIRLKLGLKPEHEEAKSILIDEVNKNDLNRFEKFKQWARENLLGLSGVAIGVAALVTTAILGTRKAIVAGARATGKFAKALAKLAKDAGPLISGLLNLLSNVVSLAGKGLAWLSSNLWVLTVAFTFFVYEYWKTRRRR